MLLHSYNQWQWNVLRHLARAVLYCCMILLSLLFVNGDRAWNKNDFEMYINWTTNQQKHFGSQKNQHKTNVMGVGYLCSSQTQQNKVWAHICHHINFAAFVQQCFAYRVKKHNKLQDIKTKFEIRFCLLIIVDELRSLCNTDKDLCTVMERLIDTCTNGNPLASGADGLCNSKLWLCRATNPLREMNC